MGKGKFKMDYKTPYGVVKLTTFFNYHLALFLHKFGNRVFINGKHRNICNGCGPAGYGAIVPDSILGVCITGAGNIHNWMYQFGETREDKILADETFGDNMDRIIRAKFEWDMHCAESYGRLRRKFHRWNGRRRYHLRLAIADNIFERAVRVGGKSSFWDKDECDFKWQELAA